MNSYSSLYHITNIIQQNSTSWQKNGKQYHIERIFLWSCTMEQEHSFALGVQSPSSGNDGTPGVNNTQDENTKNDQNIMEVPAVAVGENYDSGILFRFWKGL